MTTPETTNAPSSGRPKPIVAALLSLWCQGMGQVYLGAYRRALATGAIVLLALPVLAWLLTSPTRPSLTLALAAGLAVCLYALPALDAFRSARRSGAVAASARRRLLMGVLYFAIFIGCAILGTHAIRTLWAQAFRVPSGGMEPTLLAGDYFFVDKRAYRHREPRRGEVVAFQHPRNPRQSYVRRLVALPGDSVEVRGNVLFLNGERLTSDPLPRDEARDRDIAGSVRRETIGGLAYLVLDLPAGHPRDLPPIRIPEGLYFFLGDNRNNSADSRFWGCVTRDALIGPATHVYYSRDKEAGGARWRRVGIRLTVSE